PGKNMLLSPHAVGASPTPKPSNSLSCIIWAGHYRSNRHPKSTETKTSLCGRPEASLKLLCLKINKLHHLTGGNCETQDNARTYSTRWLPHRVRSIDRYPIWRGRSRMSASGITWGFGRGA